MGGMMSPSWKSSVERGSEPGVMPPMSAWCPRSATKPTGVGPLAVAAKTGATRVMSGRWVPPM